MRVGDRDGELLLLETDGDPDVWTCLARPARRLRPGLRLEVGEGLEVTVLGEGPGGSRQVQFTGGAPREVLPRLGQTPLPPYIHEALTDPGRYQTVYATRPGSAAAPTAGLHFTRAMLGRLRAAGIATANVTLRIGLDTFQPLRHQDLREHQMHSGVVPGAG